ncbi:hypothetical protein SCHPADRAFT_893935 [Schizopora paradoxa]|uniref:Xylanolytic transcriptional activator regulatory domain-containing protein n=1 Tax=Schizopora paradoxa TaxID=27342 RepID=A0A0H2R936_9AGAM|nr:hypothetical protein SCHPADRAFT_893935 [Schizopora paradoxa]
MPVSAAEDSSSGVVRTKGSRKVTKKYGRNACQRCKIAKVRCEGLPICHRCVAGGLDVRTFPIILCVRGLDTRKLLSKDQERSMRHQNEALKAQVTALGSTVDSLNAEVNSLRAQLASVSLAPEAQASGSQTVFIQPPSPESLNADIHQNCSAPTSVSDESEDEDMPISESEYETDHAYLLDQEGSGLDGRRDLFREYGQLYLYGLTSPFRLYLRRSRSRPSIRIRREESPARKERHVLILPGLRDDQVVPHCSCTNACWATFLPPDAPITRLEHDQLFDRLFVFYSPWCLRVIPEFFLRDMFAYTHAQLGGQASPAPTTHYSPFLHLCLLAVATAFSDDPEVSNINFRRRFVDAAKMLMEQECAHPSISAVQGLSMLGSYYSGLGEQTLGFVYFGMSARLSQALGLGSDCEHWVEKGRIRPRDLFDRYWAFHMECAQDACWALYVGREFGIPSGQSEPFSLAELADPILDTMSWRGQGPEAQQQCQTFTIFLWSCSLMKISRRIMSLMALLGQTGARDQAKLLVAEIDMQLSSWRDELPPSLKLTPGSKKSSLPIKRRRASDVNHRFSADRCTVAAKEILSILRSWKQQYQTIRFAPITLIQVIFACGTVFLLQAHEANTGRRIADQKQTEALDRVVEVIDFMKELGQSWAGALKIVGIFERLLEEQRQRMHESIELSRARKSGRRGQHSATLGADDAFGGGTPPLLSVDASENLAVSSDDGFPASAMQSSMLQLPNAYDSDGGFASDEGHTSASPSFYDQVEQANYGMHGALDLLVDPQNAFHNAGMFDFAGTAWGMPNGDALSNLPFMGPDSPNPQFLPSPSPGSGCDFSPNVASVDPSVAPPPDSFYEYSPYVHGPPAGCAQYSLDAMPPPVGAPVGFDLNINEYPTVTDAEDQPLAAMIAAMQNETYGIY